MKKTITISKEEYASLLDNSYKLAALEAGGVDNWSWYDNSIDDFWKAVFEENKQEIMDYADLIGYEFENDGECDWEDLRFVKSYFIQKQVDDKN